MRKIAIIDDNSLLRENILSRLIDDYDVCFESDNARELIKYLKTNEATNFPHLILMDIEMDEMNGIEATAIIKSMYPQIKIAMLTVFDQEDKVWRSIMAGADGYILKDETRERLLTCIEDIFNDGAYMSASIARKAIQLLQKQAPNTGLAMMGQLSNREKQILDMVITGKSYKQIAEELYLSPSTVKTHIRNVYEKLQVNNKMEAAQLVKQAPHLY